MGEFTHATGQGKTLAFVLEDILDILSLTSLMIAVISGLLGHGHTSELGDEVMRPSPFDLNGVPRNPQIVR
jgi:hypothetical protein